ncbi:alpha/beta hydrolase [Anaerococcus sp. NML200574]|uniref:alpha/beta hydrolase family protein n=1 Tax=Anaerococcus sp. NML200574 TaxID=2954486 RepID=UPI00223769AD|nr:alpha/beta hydrolase [Anaerococcus sp. NML200574]MCW6679098.1 alpha/beta hydrolase [Anaerococcus sp. NML200574]
MKIRRKLLITIVISLIMIIVGSLSANYFNTSGHSVDVKRISFDTEKGVLSGLLYKPKDADETNPRPTLVTTHGYLNSAEMQDAPAIEMSRRGYVVLALDQYDHGHSKSNSENTGSFMSFWPTSIYDAVQYMYDQDYVLKDKDKNGVIAVSGHSMGGFSTTNAVMYDQEDFKKTGIKKIYAQLSAGSDHTWQKILGIEDQAILDSMDDRFIGKIAGQFDEFFFNQEGQPGSVVKKDYVKTDEGKSILENENPKSDTWYDVKSEGKRIIYQPYQTHPWNHFSKATTKDMIDFYDVAFDGFKSEKIKEISSDNQTWMYKEASEFIGLVGFTIFFIAFAGFLSDLKIFKKIKTDASIPLSIENTSLETKFSSKLIFAFGLVLPALIYSTVYEGKLFSSGMLSINFISIIMFVLAVIGLVLNKEYKNIYWSKGSYLSLCASIVLFILSKFNVFKDSPVFQGPTVNRIVTWALICAMLSILINVYSYLLRKDYEKGVGLYEYGLKGNPGTIFLSLIIAIIVSLVSYIILFIIDATLLVDFRIWSLAFKTFETSHLISALKYMPLFFIYYLVAGAGSIINSNNKTGLRSYFYACIINMGGILLWLVLQYAKLFTTGVALYPNDALSGILLVALVPSLVIAFINTKYLYNKNKNIYLPSFINAILLTLMTVANTTIYFQV